jgi:hypothetical protein
MSRMRRNSQFFVPVSGLPRTTMTAPGLNAAERRLFGSGGARAMKTCGHLRREHSIAQAQRITFTPTLTKQADVVPFPAATT